MPWPEPIASLLARPDSRPAQALRWGLHGLRASLRAALDEAPSDSGSEDLRALLADLAALVEPRPPATEGSIGAQNERKGAATLPFDDAADSQPAGSDRQAADPPRPGPDPRVSPPDDDTLRPLADAVSACLWLAEHAPHARHGLKSVFRFGLAPLAGEQRDRYTAELLRLYERVRVGAGLGPRDRLKAHLDLDEAIHSLTHQPPSAAPPWWGPLRGQARAALFAARDRAAHAGVSAHLQELGGSFAEINRLAPDSLQVDSGVPGEVCSCLRVWARIDGEELKGRVLYRSPQEGA
jgi:hypothetical protein